MLHELEDWLARKRKRPQISIREKRTSKFKFARALGPKGQFAVVYLLGEPAHEFSFTSVAEWPWPQSDYTIAVLDGILDGILDELFAMELGFVPARVRFTLEKIEWHDVDSCATAFYHAARGAVREILGKDEFSGNIDYRSITNARS